MRKHLLTNLLITFICIATASAVPALPGKHQLTQPDGTTLTAYVHGDEFMHFFETVDGLMLQKNKNGFYCYAELSDQGEIITSSVVAREQSSRSPEENSYIKGIKQDKMRDVMLKKLDMKKSGRQKVASPGPIEKLFPTTGEVRGLIVLAQYQDVKFSKDATVENFNRMVNEENYDGPYAFGSVRDYYLAQSHGQLKLNFDVVGPVTLSQNMEYYGSKKKYGEERVPEMISESVKLAKEANPNLDFSKYNANGDDYVDFVYVIYAGYGEAQFPELEECVWPQSWSLAYVDFTEYDGLLLGNYACSCELRGKSGSDLDGIGTFCHEFGHILGLPDIYDPTYTGSAGLDMWDIMDKGSYNDDSKTPSGCTAMDKYTLGWLTPTLLDGPESVSLDAFAASNEAYFLVSETNPNEYYTFENRQKVSWDKALPGHGLLICHIDYDKKIWKTNRVNVGGIDHVALVGSDFNKRRPEERSDMRDVFPGGLDVTEFTDMTKPAMVWKNGDKVGKPITNIKESADGIITFDFRGGTSGIESYITNASFAAYSDGQTIVVTNEAMNDVAVYSISGQLIYTSKDANCRIPVDKGCYIVHIGKQTCKVNVK